MQSPTDSETKPPDTRWRGARFSLPLGVAVALLTGACGVSASALSGSSANAPAQETTIATAPESDRVDLYEPTFSNPTQVTNPLFPVSTVAQVIFLGAEAGEVLRHEVTTMPDTRVIEWNGHQVETVVSQFVAYLDGRLLEVAYDYYAQDDMGAVWYFGEDVFNYEDGVVANMDGTWLAGTDGPPGMIMPADPQVGDVYRPENIPGLVFEEVTVKSITETVAGPRGPIEGAMLIEEHLMDGTIEDKFFAPGYGEFRAHVASEDELVTVALSVPIDATPGRAPRELSVISRGTTTVFQAALRNGSSGVGSTLTRMQAAWDAYQADTDVPPLLSAQMDDALDALVAALETGSRAEVQQAAIDVATAALDLRLQYRPPAEVDLARLDLWTRQLLVDVAAGDSAAEAGDVATMEAIWARVAHTVPA